MSIRMASIRCPDCRSCMGYYVKKEGEVTFECKKCALHIEAYNDMVRKVEHKILALRSVEKNFDYDKWYKRIRRFFRDEYIYG